MAKNARKGQKQRKWPHKIDQILSNIKVLIYKSYRQKVLRNNLISEKKKNASKNIQIGMSYVKKSLVN